MKILLTTFALILWSVNALADCKLNKVSFPGLDPIDGSPWEVSAKAYYPRLASNVKAPVVFIFPPIVGETILDRRMARKMCKSGIASFILNVVKTTAPEEAINNLNIHDQNNQRALGGTRLVIQNLKGDSRLSQQYGVLGMSLGGILTAYVSGLEPQIKASVIIVGGGDLPGILSISDQKGVMAQREARMTKLGLTTAKEYEELLRTFITIDPLEAAAMIRPNSTYFFLARKDKTVPVEFQRKLLENIPSPLIYEMRGGHVKGVIKAGTVHTKKIIRFLKNRLSV